MRSQRSSSSSSSSLLHKRGAVMFAFEEAMASSAPAALRLSSNSVMMRSGAMCWVWKQHACRASVHFKHSSLISSLFFRHPSVSSVVTGIFLVTDLLLLLSNWNAITMCVDERRLALAASRVTRHFVRQPNQQGRDLNTSSWSQRSPHSGSRGTEVLYRPTFTPRL